MNRPICRVFHDFRLCIAHRLPNVDPNHKCSRLHGHNYRVRVVLEGPIDPHMGWVRDYAEIAIAWAAVHQALDHRYLNEIPGLENSTSENLCVWIWERLKPSLPELVEIEAREVDDAGSIYRGQR